MRRRVSSLRRWVSYRWTILVGHLDLGHRSRSSCVHIGVWIPPLPACRPSQSYQLRLSQRRCSPRFSPSFHACRWPHSPCSPKNFSLPCRLCCTATSNLTPHILGWMMSVHLHSLPRIYTSWAILVYVISSLVTHAERCWAPIWMQSATH